MEIRILESAKDDLHEGWNFYEQISTGLGDYFLDSVQADIRSLSVYAGVHEKAGGYHRMLTKRFPFAIYYKIDDQYVDIYAILDCRRDPNWIAKRLDSSHTDR